MATMLAYVWILTSFDSASAKGSLTAISAGVSVVGLATAIRVLGWRVDPASAVVALTACFAVLVAVWLVTIDRSALECWSCVSVDEHDFRQTNGASALWDFVMLAAATVGTAVTTSIGVLLVGRALDQRRV